MSQTIDEARSQTQQARDLLEQKKQEAEQSKKQIEEARSKLPNYQSQRALRGSYGGLKGRANRQVVINAEKELESKKGQVEKFQEEVLNPYEEQVSQSEAQIRDYDLQQQAITLAQKFYDARVPYSFLKGEENPYVYEYTKQLYENANATAELNAKLDEAVAQANAGVPTDIAFKGLNLEYLKKKGFVKETTLPSTPESNLASNNFNLFISPNSQTNNLLGMLTRLDRTDQVKLSSNYQSLVNSPLIPLVSAKNISPPVNPPSQINVAPSLFSRLKQNFNKNINENGNVVQAGLNTIGGLGQSQYEKAVQQGKTSAYQSEAIQNLIGALPQTAYFTPAGPSLLALGGTSQLVSYGVKPEILQNKATRTQEFASQYGVNVPRGVAVGTNIGLPIAEAGLGFFGLKGQYTNIKNVRGAKLFEESPKIIAGGRIEGNQGGIDILYGYKRTSPNWIDRNILGLKPSESVTKIIQPFYNTEAGGKVVLEGGKGFTIFKSGKNIRTSTFDIFGAGKNTKGTLRYGKGGLISDTGYQSGGGYINIREKLVSQGVLQKDVNLLTGEIKYYYQGKLVKSDNAIRKLFIGGSKEENNLIKVISGEPKLINRDLVTGKTTLRGVPNTAGYIKKLEFKGNNVFFSSSSQGLKTEGASASYVPTALEEASKLANRQTETTILKSSKEMGIFPVAKTEFQKVETKTNQETLQIVKPSLKKETKTKTRQIEILKQIPKEKTQNRLKNITIQAPKEFEKQTPRFRNVLNTLFKQETKQKQTSKAVTKTKTINPIKPNKPLAPILPTTKKGKVQKIIEDNFGSFEAFGKRFGKDLSLGKFKTKKEAERSLLSFLKGSLGASGVVKQGNRNLNIKELDLFKNNEFRAGKNDSSRIVQKSSFRLSSGQEKREIKYFKKKSKNKKFKWFS